MVEMEHAIGAQRQYTQQGKRQSLPHTLRYRQFGGNLEACGHSPSSLTAWSTSVIASLTASSMLSLSMIRTPDSRALVRM